MSPNKEDEKKSLSAATETSTSANVNSVNQYNKENCAASSIKHASHPQDSNKKAETPSHAPGKKSAMDFRFGKIIGEGSYSTVYLAQDVHTLKEYASKC
jgi:hypothetical protein